MKPVGKPDAGNPHVRFDERGRETEPLAMRLNATAPFLDSTIFLNGYSLHTRYTRRYHPTMESAVHPIPGTDYPRTFHEMDQWFRTDAACHDYVRRLRWPNGFVCAECGAAGEPWTMSRDRFRCRACEWETT
jgi:hypothetical protein